MLLSESKIKTGKMKTGFSIILLFVIISCLSPFIAPFSYHEIVSQDLRLPPIWQQVDKTPHLLGTDDLGRDLFSRLVYGAPKIGRAHV